MFVKICGVRTAGDVAAAVDAGADAIGFMLTTSVRLIGTDVARQLGADVPDHVLTVGVINGVPAEEAARLAAEAEVRAVQLHGDYPKSVFDRFAGGPYRLIRAVGLTPATVTDVGAFGEDLLLLDSMAGGSGERWDLGQLAAARPAGKWILAGGLAPDNVAAAITEARPWGVDVSSGVESSRGVKDHDRIRAFIEAARTVQET